MLHALSLFSAFGVVEPVQRAHEVAGRGMRRIRWNFTPLPIHRLSPVFFTHETSPPFFRVTPTESVGGFLFSRTTRRNMPIVACDIAPSVCIRLTDECSQPFPVQVKAINGFLASIDSSCNGTTVIRVLFWRHPFEIFRPVVQFVFVSMIYLCFVLRVIVGTKRFSHKPVQSGLFALAFPPQTNMRISRMLDNGGYFPHRQKSAAVIGERRFQLFRQSPYPSHIAYHVKPFIPRDIFPDFSKYPVAFSVHAFLPPSFSAMSAASAA